MTKMKNICVYCGSGPGRNPAYSAAAKEFGSLCARQNIGIVYGGANIGIMGEVAHAALDAGGRVTGVLPKFWYNTPQMHNGLSELIITQSMHERKQLMYDLSDAFVALPGGIGTLEELVEMMTWEQLGHHTKPIVIANIEDFWKPLISLLEHMSSDEFIRSGMEVSYQVADTVEEILPKLGVFQTSLA
jgi:uncharacterized protein (TIGR00730 family)